VNPTVAGAPSSVAARSGNTTAALTCKAPSSDGGSAITGYKVYRATSSGGETLLATVGTGTGWTDTSVTNGTTYYYQVSAVNSVGESGRSGERSATPAAPASAPAAPTLSSASASGGSIALSWSAPSDGGSAITGYRIYRGSTSGGETLLTTVGTVTSWTDTGLGAGTTYYYQVSAVNSVGESGRSNERSATTASSGDAIAPTTPTNMTTLLSGPTQVVIDWASSSDNVGVTGYQVYRDGSLVATTTNSWFVDSGLGASTTHTYQVRALDAAGNRSAASVTMSSSTVGYGIGTNGTLAGVIFDAAGNVVTNVVVRVVGTTKMVRTDRNGVWQFQLMAPTTYSITATYTSAVTFSITGVSKQTVITAATLP
jgi:fibronectin type 3 domain-containing protein